VDATRTSCFVQLQAGCRGGGHGARIRHALGAGAAVGIAGIDHYARALPPATRSRVNNTGAAITRLRVNMPATVAGASGIDQTQIRSRLFS
jgi:hypothetical protein